MSQEVTYFTTEADYNKTRDETLERMKKGDNIAFVNPADGPWMRVETTAAIGIAYKGVSSSSGRKHLRQISAAEEALYPYDKWKADGN